MTLSWVATNAFSALLLPPVLLVLVVALALLWRRRWPRSALWIGLASLLLLLVLCTTAGAHWLVQPLEDRTAPLSLLSSSIQAHGATAIVVLGGGRLNAAPEYDGADSPSFETLTRLRYAARLQRITGLPILVSGGRPDGAAESEASLMARSLQDDFRVPTRWREQASNNTAENAEYSRRILHDAGIKRVLLVTDALHMPRAQAIFRHVGMEVVPAPTWFVGHERLALIDFLPRGEGLRRSR
ncbi:MAG: YdcF family protein [Herbaspirillum sp.]